MAKVISISDHEQLIGASLGVSDWLRVNQEQVNQFAELGGDQQWIHTDVDRAAKESPFGATIVHGYLIMAFTPQLMDQVFSVNDAAMGVNRGFDKLRFIAPLKVGDTMRLNVDVLRVEVQEEYSDVHYLLTFEGENMAKPICVAELLKRWVKA